MPTEALELIAAAGQHGILIVALYVLWKRLEKVTDALISMKKDIQALNASNARKEDAGDRLSF